MANSSERRRQWNFVVAGLGCYKKWPVKKRVFTEDRSKPKPPVWSLIIGIFFLYQYQLKCGCELNDQIESFNFDSVLWPIEQVWVLGLLSIFLCLIFFFFLIIKMWLLIEWFSANFSLIAAANLVIRLKDAILESLYHLLDRFDLPIPSFFNFSCFVVTWINFCLINMFMYVRKCNCIAHWI